MSDLTQRCPVCGILFFDDPDIPAHADDLLLIREEGSCYVCQFEKWMKDKLARLCAQTRKETQDERDASADRDADV